MFSCTLSICSTESVDGYSWGRTVAENMNFHSVVNDFFCHIIVPVPQESQIISVVLSHQKAVKHLLYVCQDGNLFLTEPQQNSRVIHNPDLAWFFEGGTLQRLAGTSILRPLLVLEQPLHGRSPIFST